MKFIVKRQTLKEIFRIHSHTTSKIIGQEYPTEPLRNISVLQAILKLAGKFLTGIEILLGI